VVAAGAPSVDGSHPLADGDPCPWTRPSGDEAPKESSPPALDLDQVIEMLKEASPGEWEGEKATISAIRNHLVATNRPEVLNRSAALLAGVEREVLDARVAEVTVVGIPDAGSLLELPLRGAPPPADLAVLASSGTVLTRLTVPLVSSRTGWFLRGTESTMLEDYEVEIAQSASIADPVMRRTFSGITGSIRITSSGDEPSAKLDILCLEERAARRPLEEQSLGVVDRKSTTKVHFERYHRFKEGEKLTLGEGVPANVKGTGYRTIVQVSIRKP
jgi:hypothetical protein